MISRKCAAARSCLKQAFERRVSAGKAAELAGVSLDEFLEFAAQRDVPMHYAQEDWEQDQTVARKLKL